MCVSSVHAVQQKSVEGKAADANMPSEQQAHLLGLTPRTTETETLQQLASWLVWLGIFSFPLVLSTGDLYKRVFPSSWYEVEGKGTLTQRTVGLACGLLGVVSEALTHDSIGCGGRVEFNTKGRLRTVHRSWASCSY